MIKNYTILFLICSFIFYCTSLSYAALHISYDGKPIRLSSGETQKYFSIINNSLSEEAVTVSIVPLVNINSNNDYVSKYSAVSLLSISNSNVVINSGEKVFFSVSAEPIVPLENHEYYAMVKVDGYYNVSYYPLVVKVRDAEEQNPSMSICVKDEDGDKYIKLTNSDEVHQLLDVLMRSVDSSNGLLKEEYVYRDKIVLPGESLDYKVLSSDIKSVYDDIRCIVVLNHENTKEITLKNN